jgi:hypothetical protein
MNSNDVQDFGLYHELQAVGVRWRSVAAAERAPLLLAEAIEDGRPIVDRDDR